MNRYTITVRHQEFLQCSFEHKLCFALRCPEMAYERGLNHSKG